MHSSILVNFLLAFASFHLVVGHGVVTSVTGSNGIVGAGFGVDPSTPRDGSRPNPFEQDTSIIRNNEIQSGKTDVCGRTKIGGNNDVSTQLAGSCFGIYCVDAGLIVSL